MKRRNFVLGVALFTGAAYSGYKIFDFFKSPDLHFLDSQSDLIAELTEIVIPKTDTPGAKDVFASKFVIKFLKDCADDRMQNNFIDGLKNLTSLANTDFKKDFIGCSIKEKIELLTKIEQSEKLLPGIPGKIQKKVFGKPFTYILKEYASKAYFTSFLGATQGLSYLMVPGRRISCIDLEPNQKSWATQ